MRRPRFTIAQLLGVSAALAGSLGLSEALGFPRVAGLIPAAVAAAGPVAIILAAQTPRQVAAAVLAVAVGVGGLVLGVHGLRAGAVMPLLGPPILLTLIAFGPLLPFFSVWVYRTVARPPDRPGSSDEIRFLD